MKNFKMSEKTKNLLLFIAIVAVGLALIVIGFIIDYNDKQAFGKPFGYKPAYYVYLLEISGALVFLLSFGFLHTFLQEVYNLKKMSIKQMAVIGVFGSLSIVLYYFAKFKLPIFPSWLDFQFSDVPALIVSFMYGPFSGALVIVVRFFCKLPGTSTVGVGELADLLIGLSFVITAGIIYKRHRTLKGALAATSLGVVAGTLMGVLGNWLILIPAYKQLANYSQSALNDMLDKAMFGGQGFINDNNFMPFYLLVAVLPFNLLRYAMVFVVTFILYKRLSIFINYVTGANNTEENEIDEIITNENNA